jgi:hypothetical protein
MAQADHRAYPNGVRMQRRMNPQAQLITLARFIAKSHARAALKEQGIRVQYVEPRQLHLAAEALLRERWAEFAEQAQTMLAKIEANSVRKPARKRTLSFGLAQKAKETQP